MIENTSELVAFLALLAIIFATLIFVINTLSTHHARRIEAMEDEYYNLNDDNEDDSYL